MFLDLLEFLVLQKFLNFLNHLSSPSFLMFQDLPEFLVPLKFLMFQDLPEFLVPLKFPMFRMFHQQFLMYPVLKIYSN
jgi:hypothetical protein